MIDQLTKKEIMKSMTTIIRLFTYKSFRHYGGREITSTPHLCKAKVIEKQKDGSMWCELLEDCAGFKAGHKIAVWTNDFDVK